MKQPDRWSQRICKDCLTEWSLTPDEVRHYTQPGHFLPVRCVACRRARRRRLEGERPTPTTRRPTVYGGWASSRDEEW